MTKTTKVVLLIGALLISASITSLVTQPVHAAKTRKITAGAATLQIPLHMPGEVVSGTPTSGSVLLGSKDECDVTYDHFSGIYWSDRVIASSKLLPTPAYTPVSEQVSSLPDSGGGSVKCRTIKLSAEKPCGKIVEETLTVIDLYCASSKTYFAVVGMQDPFMTQQRVAEIAQSLKCS